MPLHQFILLTQGPIGEIFTKKILRIGRIEKLSFFEWAILNSFFHTNFFLFHPHKNQSNFLGQQGWVEILMITLVSSNFLAMRNITLYSVRVF